MADTLPTPEELDRMMQAQGGKPLPSPDQINAMMRAGPPQPSLDYYGSIQDNGPLRLPKELATDAAIMAGSYAVPEIAGLAKGIPLLGKLAPVAADAGAGALKTVLSYLNTGAWGAAGAAVGQEGAEAAGLQEDTPWDTPEKLKGDVTNTAIGAAFGAGADRLARGSNALKFANELDPQVQRAKGLTERLTGAKGDPLPQQVEAANLRSKDLPDAILAALGPDAGMSTENVALGERLRKSIPELQQMGVFDHAGDTKELLNVVDATDGGINRARTEAVRTAGNHIEITQDDLAPELAGLQRRVLKLRKNPETAGIGDAIEETVNNALTAMQSRPGGVGARDAVDMMQNWNEYRRVLAREFNNAQVAATAKGEVPNLAANEASREALAELRSGMSRALDDKFDGHTFSDLNRQQGALHDLEDATNYQIRGTRQAQADRPASRLVKTAAQQGGNPAAFATDVVTQGPGTAILKKLTGWLGGGAEEEVSPQLQNMLRTENRNTGAMSNIRDAISLNQNPAPAPVPNVAPLGGRGAQAGIVGATGAQALYQLGQSLGPSQAQAQTPEQDDLTNQFNTPLSPSEQQGFSAWVQTLPPRLQSAYDYDLQGFYKANGPVPFTGDTHMPDTFKKPNHETFSVESQYSTPQNPGGTWTGPKHDQFAPPRRDLTGVVSQMFGPGPAPAQTMPVPRDSNAVLQNPQMLIQKAAEISNNNPQLMQDVMTVIKEPNELKRSTAFAHLAQSMPQLFEPTPWRSLWDGRITDPQEVAMFGDQLKTKFRTGAVDSNFLAKQQSAMNADGTVLPEPPPPPPVQPQQSYPVSFGDGPRDYAY